MSIKKILGVSNEMSMTDVKYIDVWMLLGLVPSAINKFFLELPEVMVLGGIILFLYFLTLGFIASLVRRTFKEMKFETNVYVEKAMLIDDKVEGVLKNNDDSDDK